ncbi:MAG: hypothetical protein ACI4JJ_02095 [Huintestinicola sp.]
MEEKEKEIISDEVTENAEAEPPRPAPDPKNKLYTVICIVIGIAVYFGWNFIRENISLTYSLYQNEFSPEDQAVIMAETGFSEETLPEGAGLAYARLSCNFDKNTLYVVFSDIGDIEAFAENLPFDYAEGEPDERFTVYPDETMVPDFVYGYAYADTADPSRMCIVYEREGMSYAEFRITEYDSAVKAVMRGGVKAAG